MPEDDSSGSWRFAVARIAADAVGWLVLLILCFMVAVAHILVYLRTLSATW